MNGSERKSGLISLPQMRSDFQKEAIQAFNSKLKYEKLAVVLYFLEITQNLVILPR